MHSFLLAEIGGGGGGAAFLTAGPLAEERDIPGTKLSGTFLTVLKRSAAGAPAPPAPALPFLSGLPGLAGVLLLLLPASLLGVEVPMVEKDLCFEAKSILPPFAFSSSLS